MTRYGKCFWEQRMVVPSTLLRTKHLMDSDKLVYFLLSALDGDSRHVSAKEISKYCEMNEKLVGMCLNRLTEAGYLDEEGDFDE
ncbi:hypothetical protein [Ligilactobacillus sp. LYQ60]|uniref:hypothetical protein n=1 Tax=Ligilactobacillus sp. LYQ60 TaxID=3378799 RepID=UPI0038539E28